MAIFEWYRRPEASATTPVLRFDALGEWLQTTLAELQRSIIFALDDLDECDVESRAGLIQSLKDQTRPVPQLKVLLLCRPKAETLMQVRKISTISLCCDTKRDGLIVEEEWVERRLSKMPDDVKTLVTERLSWLAQGSAIWVRMTVELIQAREITELGPMKACLAELPPPEELSELYNRLFSCLTSEDPRNEQLAALVLMVLTVAQRPLSLLELSWAAVLVTAPG